ncbi:MAG: glycerate kinase [Selenomonadaceae bacterium]|nr:glycerate kinase [Selenomonadaceae bacterium]
MVIALDSLKGSLTSLEAGDAIRGGILRVCPDAAVQVRPLADGGEGTVEALTLGMGGSIQKVSVTGPLGEKVEAAYGILQDGCTAIVEMAAAAGITLVPTEERNPYRTTTYGVGEILKDAMGKGCRHFIVGIGGSATNDGGLGMLQALGYGMLDADGKDVPFGAEGLQRLARIETGKVLPELEQCRFRIACDVTNPLCGENGCSAVYGPQKGATDETIPRMDKWLADYAVLSRKTFAHADPDFAGAGAAGGMGFAFLTYTNAVLESGIRIVLEETRLEEYVREADLVITGEGRLDAQTVMGKAPVGVADIAKRHGKPVLAFAGCVTRDATACNAHGIDAFFPILRGVSTLEEAMDADNARQNMMDTVEQAMRLIQAGIGL